MSKKSFVALCFSVLVLCGCTKSSKTIIRMQKMEEGVHSPTSKEELQAAISKYENRVADIQLAETQVGIWYKMLAVRFLDQKMYGEAMKNFQKAITFYPANQNLYYWVGVCAGYMAKASLDFEGKGENPDKRNYLKLAESSFLRAIELEPRYARVLYSLGILYVFELNECDKAIPHLEKLLTIEKMNIDAMFILARAYYVEGDYDKAISLYDRIITGTKSEQKKQEAQNNKQTIINLQYSK